MHVDHLACTHNDTQNRMKHKFRRASNMYRRNKSHNTFNSEDFIGPSELLWYCFSRMGKNMTVATRQNQGI